MELMRTSTEPVHVRFARGDFQLISDQWSRDRVSAINGKIDRVTKIIPALRRLVERLHGVVHIGRKESGVGGRCAVNGD